MSLVFVKQSMRRGSVVAAYTRTNSAANRVAKRIATVLGGKGYSNTHIKRQRLDLLKKLNTSSKELMSTKTRKLNRGKKLLKGNGMRSRRIY